jgi:hypothetical protein
MLFLEKLCSNPEADFYLSLKSAYLHCVKNNHCVGAHGYLLPFNDYQRFSPIFSFYQKHKDLLSEFLHFWKTDQNVTEFAPHIDSPDINKNMYSIAFGLINCSDRIQTHFYIPLNPKPKIHYINEIYFLDKNEKCETKSFSIQTNQSYLFNSNLWHGVINSSDQLRVVASWWLKSDIDIDLVKKEFLIG